MIDANPAPAARASRPLTQREREVAILIARGLTSREIAEELVIATRTVDTHADSIRNKLGLSSRRQVAALVVSDCELCQAIDDRRRELAARRG